MKVSKNGKNVQLLVVVEYKEIVASLNRAECVKEYMKDLKEIYPNIYSWLKISSVLHISWQPDKPTKKSE
jgi:hypothetical protein